MGRPTHPSTEGGSDHGHRSARAAPATPGAPGTPGIPVTPGAPAPRPPAGGDLPGGQSFFDLSGVGMAEADGATGRFLRVNRRLCDLTGYPAAELLGLSFLQLTHPDDRAATEAEFAAVCRGEKPEYRLEKRYVRKDGTPVWVQVTATAVRDAAGRALRHLAVVEDISARKAAVEEIAALARFPAESPDAILRIARDYTLIYANANAGPLLEYCGCHLGHPLPEAIQAWVQMALASGKALRQEHVLDWRTYALTFAPVAEAGYVNVYARDVTERRQIEQSLRDNEARMRAIVTTAVDGIITIDEYGVIEMVNPAVERIFGYRAEELIGRNIEVLMPEPYRSEHDRYLHNYRQTGVPKIIGIGREVAGRRKDGTEFPLDLAISEVRLGPRRMFTGVVRDITQRKEAENARRELNETLERRVAERTAVAQRRAGQLRLLANELAQTEQRERHRLAQVLHDGLQQLLVAAGLRLNTLRTHCRDDHEREHVEHVQELLNESIAASRSLTVELSPPVLYEAGLGPALQWLGRWMREKHGLSVRVRADLAADPCSDELRYLLFQGVRELLFNVVKHAGVKEASVTMQRNGNESIRITVEDQGAGFDPAQLPAEGSATGGFGLFSIQQRLELLGGELEINSRVGEGTQMVLDAPLEPGQDQAAGAAEPRLHLEKVAQRDGRIRVLLADDHKILRQGLVGLLREQEDIEVVGEAADGAAALEMARALHPDVAVLDVTMPRMNGIEAARRIHAELPEVRVIGLSMHEKEDMAAAMRAAGAEAYLTKDGPSEALIAAIRGKAPAGEAA